MLALMCMQQTLPYSIDYNSKNYMLVKILQLY